MRKALLTLLLGSMLTPIPAIAATHHRHRQYHSSYSRRKAHRNTAKRVAVGTLGGAAIGALAGGGKGAGIGAIAGAGAGYLYDRHEKHTGHN